MKLEFPEQRISYGPSMVKDLPKEDGCERTGSWTAGKLGDGKEESVGIWVLKNDTHSRMAAHAVVS